MSKRIEYDIDEILAILNQTKSWRAVDKHFKKGNGVVKSWLNNRNIEFEEVHYFKKKN